MSWRGRAQEVALNQQQHHCIQGCLDARSDRMVDCHCTSSCSSCTRGTPQLPAPVCVSAEHCAALPPVVTLPVKGTARRSMAERPCRCPFSAAVGRLREPARRAGTDDIAADGNSRRCAPHTVCQITLLRSGYVISHVSVSGYVISHVSVAVQYRDACVRLLRGRGT